jgi:putative oxidoreductase
LYFLGPGIAKVFNYSNYVAVMEQNEVPLTLLALPTVILIQVIGGVMLILNQNIKVFAWALFLTTIVINIYIHDFWTLEDGISKSHETQNFVKNLAICAGLLVLASREKFVKLG